MMWECVIKVCHFDYQLLLGEQVKKTCGSTSNIPWSFVFDTYNFLSYAMSMTNFPRVNVTSNNFHLYSVLWFALFILSLTLDQFLNSYLHFTISMHNLFHSHLCKVLHRKTRRKDTYNISTSFLLLGLTFTKKIFIFVLFESITQKYIRIKIKHFVDTFPSHFYVIVIKLQKLPKIANSDN